MKIAVFGAKGRVGSCLCELAQKQGHTVIPVEKDTDLQRLQRPDVVIDFSTAKATESVCAFCRLHLCPLVTGVTGRNDSQQQQLEQLKSQLPVVERANFSCGIEKLREICKLLAPLGWDCAIVETHHKAKADSPGGTAKELAICTAQNGTRQVSVLSIRAGSNFGKHEIIFATQGESITVTHQAENVEIFAKGALQAAQKLADEKK